MKELWSRSLQRQGAMIFGASCEYAIRLNTLDLHMEYMELGCDVMQKIIENKRHVCSNKLTVSTW